MWGATNAVQSFTRNGGAIGGLFLVHDGQPALPPRVVTTDAFAKEHA
jgi:hypothetical protein